jgi:hypothetical protein
MRASVSRTDWLKVQLPDYDKGEAFLEKNYLCGFHITDGLIGCGDSMSLRYYTQVFTLISR